MRAIVLCADDYGQSPAISNAIIGLIRQKRISATSCLTTAPAWPEHAHWLQPYIDQIDTGLHFNLTEGHPLNQQLGKAFLSLNQLLIKSYLRQISYQFIYQELQRQINNFKQCLGKYPDYIDGHQHVHQFPVIRNAIVAALTDELPKTTYLRIPRNKHFFSQFPKNMLISLLGANALKSLCQRQRIPHNTSFSGIYNFAQGKNYRALFRQFLQEIDDNGIIMCHPGLKSIDKSDPIYLNRHDEYQYLISDDFLADCEKNKIKITRFAPFLSCNRL